MPLTIGIVLFVVTKVFIGGWTMPLGVGLLGIVAAFAMFNRGATSGLVHANLTTYATGRRHLELSHIDALRRTVEARYAILPSADRAARIDYVWGELMSRDLGEDERGDIKAMVIAMFASENPHAITIPALARLMKEFDLAATRHGLPETR